MIEIRAWGGGWGWEQVREVVSGFQGLGFRVLGFRVQLLTLNP
jgi:hypothetical protein